MLSVVKTKPKLYLITWNFLRVPEGFKKSKIDFNMNPEAAAWSRFALSSTRDSSGGGALGHRHQQEVEEKFPTRNAGGGKGGHRSVFKGTRPLRSRLNETLIHFWFPWQRWREPRHDGAIVSSFLFPVVCMFSLDLHLLLPAALLWTFPSACWEIFNFPSYKRE